MKKQYLMWTLMLILCCNVLPAILSTSSTFNLSVNINKLGRHTVCADEVVIYTCSSYSGTLIWNIYLPDAAVPSFTHIYHASDNITTPNSKWIDNLKPAIAILVGNTMMNVTSQLIFPFTPGWNGTMIQCGINADHTDELKYIIADLPSSPSIYQPATDVIADNYVKVQWSIEHDTVDYSMTKIVINGTDLISVSYPSKSVVLNISDYLFNESIEIEVYGVNMCGMTSEHAIKRMKTIRPPEPPLSTVILAVIGTFIGSILIGLFFGSLFTCCCRSIISLPSSLKAFHTTTNNVT